MDRKESGTPLILFFFAISIIISFQMRQLSLLLWVWQRNFIDSLLSLSFQLLLLHHIDITTNVVFDDGNSNHCWSIYLLNYYYYYYYQHGNSWWTDSYPTQPSRGNTVINFLPISHLFNPFLDINLTCWSPNANEDHSFWVMLAVSIPRTCSCWSIFCIVWNSYQQFAL